jgi:hypothetical protein
MLVSEGDVQIDFLFVTMTRVDSPVTLKILATFGTALTMLNKTMAT